MKYWQKRFPPYEGEEPYLYFAFSGADSRRAGRILRALVKRGCRVWYCAGQAGGAEELLRRQKRAIGAALTVVYLTDAVCADKETKSSVLVNQKYGKKILCLDPDGADRRLSMGLREDIPHLALYPLRGKAEREDAILHAEGFSQELFGRPYDPDQELLKRLSRLFAALAMALLVTAYVGLRFFHWFQPAARDEVLFSDPVIRAAVRQEARGGAITKDLTERLVFLRLDAIPESWEELSNLPALERIELPQQALLGEEALPEGDYVLEVSGGGA